MKCPNCGGDIQSDDSKDFCFSMFCGTKIMNEATVVRKICVDRSSEIIGLLNLSVLAMREGRFQKANDLLDDALGIDGMISTERLWRQPTL